MTSIYITARVTRASSASNSWSLSSDPMGSRYANNNSYKTDMIRKEVYVHKSVMEELKRIIDDTEIPKEDNALWPPPD